MFKLLTELFAPVTDAGAGGSGPAIEDRSMSKEDMLDFLNDESQEPADVLDLTDKGGKKPAVKADKEKPQEGETSEETTEETTEEQPEVDELAELEQELEPPTDEQLELMTPVRRKEILSKYPTLFKDFPYLERAYYRDQQFSEMFTTPEEAKEAISAKQTLDNFEQEVMKGDITTILKSVRETDPNAFNNLVDNYLSALHETDEKAYFHLLGNVSKNTIIAMAQEARRSNNEQLMGAAHLLNQFLFGTSNFENPTPLGKPRERNGKDDELEKKEQEFNRRQFETAKDTVNDRINKTIINTIDTHIDPKGTMTDYVKTAAKQEVSRNLLNLMQKDSRFTSIADKLWEAAFKDSFSPASMDRIRQAYLSKARTVLPALIKQARVNALKGMGKRVNADDTSETTDRKGPIPAGRPRSQVTNSGKIKEAKDIPKGMKTIDFLNSD